MGSIARWQYESGVGHWNQRTNRIYTGDIMALKEDMEKLIADLTPAPAPVQATSVYVSLDQFYELLVRIEKFNKTMPSNHQI